MEKLITISEAAAITGLSEYNLRKLDEEGTFPAVKTSGKHRRYKMKDIQTLDKKLKSKYGLWYSVELHPLSLEDIKKGTDSFIPEIWQKRHISTGIVKDSDWKLGEKSGFYYTFPDFPKVFAWGHLSREPIKDNVIISFPLSEKLNEEQKLKNIKCSSICYTVEGPPNRHIHRWYSLPEKYFKIGFTWNYGHPSLIESGIHSVCSNIFIVVKDEAFEENDAIQERS